MTVQDLPKSAALFEQAQQIIPGGVNSPVRAFKSVGLQPPFIQRAAGARVYDVDGNAYIDYVGSWGPMILGHAHPQVVAAVQAAAASGCSFGAPTELEVRLAQLIVEAFPSIDMVRMVNSGTEATMSALRVARGFTGRDLAVKFIGCYHGHVDSLLVKAGSGVATLGITDSAGVPRAFADTTIPLPFNSIAALEQCFAEHGGKIACVIVEPVVGNMGCVPPQAGFLEALREITSRHGALLIFDEVMTGFRLALGGAQQLYAVTPDLTTLGKVIGGGLPVGAYGGRLDVMRKIAPLGPVYQAGTLSGNPLAVAGGLAMLRVLRESPGIYDALDKRCGRLADGVAAAARQAGVALTINRVGSMITFFFHDGPVRNFEEASRSDAKQFARFFHGMLDEGIYLPCSQYEAAFLSAELTDQDIEATIAAAGKVLSELGRETQKRMGA